MLPAAQPTIIVSVNEWFIRDSLGVFTLVTTLPHLRSIVAPWGNPRLGGHRRSQHCALRPRLPVRVGCSRSCASAVASMAPRTHSLTLAPTSVRRSVVHRVRSSLDLQFDRDTFGTPGDLVTHLHRPAAPSARDGSRLESTAMIPASSSRDAACVLCTMLS